MSQPPRVPLPGRLVGLAIVVVVLAVALRATWDLLAPIAPSLAGLLLLGLLARAGLRRFTR